MRWACSCPSDDRTAASPFASTTRRSGSSSIRGRATISPTPGSRWTTRRRCAACRKQLTKAGFPTADLGDDVARARRVQRVHRVEDPNGVPIELFHGPERAAEPFRSPLVPSGFVTGDEGLGHVVFATMDPQATERFYCELLGMRLSDRIEAELAPGFSLLITFLHANPRHHTVAFAAAPMPKRVHHFMLEVGAMDDVGRAYDRCLTAGIEIANTLGVHPNDRMFSFYARTPSGFDVEFGWGGRKIDDATWKVDRYDRLSVWGHRMPGTLPSRGA